ncbi:MAG: hypothetical protein H0T71_16925, partial [Acidobacteria bacterium]|nr:hypothetical protein [Acidobacteriota bacterium]
MFADLTQRRVTPRFIVPTLSTQLAASLRDAASTILERWEARARLRPKVARLPKVDLLDSLPELLERIATE